MKKPLVLTVIDGLGFAKPGPGNAFDLAKTPIIDYLIGNYPNLKMHAAGKYVGLPVGQMGNSEVGHLNIGAGRIVYTGLSLINEAISNKTFFSNSAFATAISNAKKNNSNLHIMGLLSDGGVHSALTHIIALLKLAHDANFSNVYVHAFADGRDVDPQSIKKYLVELDQAMTKYVGQLASIGGRFYAMDRDQIFERNMKAYDVFVNLKGASFENVNAYIDAQYHQNIFDEFIIPAFNRKLKVAIKDNDSIIFANFRPDRARQITHGFIGSKLYDWTPVKQLKNLTFVTMMEYADIDSVIAFKPQVIKEGLGEALAKNNLTQLRVAETQKYAHVTFFFDGSVDQIYPLEKRIMVDSLKVADFSTTPAMSAQGITDAVIANLSNFDVIILNFANPDMVGHTGKLAPAIKAVEIVDDCIGQIYKALQKVQGTLIVTADHGNAEIMLDNKGTPAKKHTSSLVPFILTDRDIKLDNRNPKLADVAPTIMKYLQLPIPVEMTGKNLIKN